MPRTKKGHKKYKKRRTQRVQMPHIEVYGFIKNQEFKNGKLYNNEKKVIYNPSVTPYPIEEERHFIQDVSPIMGLEKHVHFNLSKNRIYKKKNFIPNDSFILYKKRKNK